MKVVAESCYARIAHACDSLKSGVSHVYIGAVTEPTLASRRFVERLGSRGPLFSQYRQDNRGLARAGITLQEKDLLPGAMDELPFADRDGNTLALLDEVERVQTDEMAITRFLIVA
jgi:hypothetical protein